MSTEQNPFDKLISLGKQIVVPGPFKAIFLVGSTGTGRRTAAKILAQTVAIQPVVVDAFHFELRERCHAAYKLFDRQRLPAPANYFDDSGSAE